MEQRLFFYFFVLEGTVKIVEKSTALLKYIETRETEGDVVHQIILLLFFYSGNKKTRPILHKNHFATPPFGCFISENV